MAVIKLSEIPNAPQQVANMTMSPQYAGDQVGGQAKADIARGFEGQMQNVQAAGAMGRATAAFGNDMTSAGGNLTSGALYIAKGQKTAELKQAEVTGMQPFYANKLKIENEYQDRISNPDNNIPVEQRAAEWLKITKGGQRFSEGLDPQQQSAYMAESTRAFTGGLAQASNEAHVFQRQQFAVKQGELMDTYMQQKQYGEVRKLKENAILTGAITPQDGEKIETNVKTNEQYDGVINSMRDDTKGELYKSIKATGEAGGSIKNAPNLSPENLVKLGKIGEAIHYQNVWANSVDPMMKRIQAKHIIDPKQLEQYPEFQVAPEEQKQMLRMRAAYNRTGDEAKVYDTAGQNLVDTFPKDLNNPTKELLDRKTWIGANVSDATAPVLIKKLDEKFAEMVGNNGRLKPETGVMTNAAQQVDAIFDSGKLIDDKLSVLDAKIRKGTASKTELESYLKGSAIKDSIMEKVRAAGPQNDADATKIINQETRNYRATHPKTEHGGFLWLKKQGVPAPVINTTDNANPIIKIAGSGTTFGYKGDPNMDSNTAKGIGDHDNKLADGSVGFSREIKKQISAQGIKKGDPIILHFEDGTKIAAVNDDTTDKGLKGRVDFFNPNGPDQNPYEGKKIVGVQRG